MECYKAKRALSSLRLQPLYSDSELKNLRNEFQYKINEEAMAEIRDEK
jgi:hypothetical protein